MKHLILACSLIAAVGAVAAPAPGQKKGPPPAKAPAAKPAARPIVGQRPAAPQAKPAPKANPGARPIVGMDRVKQAEAERAHRSEFRESSRRLHMQGAGGHREPPHRTGFHANRPHGARYWGRPPAPPPMAGYRHGWNWVPTPWSYYVDGVYYYGEGYYFDGYNYCYNGGFHFAPPPVQPAYVVPQQVVVPQPAVVAPQPVVVPQPAVVAPQPVVVPQPAVVAPQPPPPPPPRSRGLLNVLFGN